MTTPVIIWGATGQLLVLAEFCNDLDYKIIALIDNDETCVSPIAGVPIFYRREGFEEFMQLNKSKGCGFLVAIGGDKGEQRAELSEFLFNSGLEPISAIHPQSYIAKNAKTGAGIQVMANATVAVNSTIGAYTIINTGASVDHECTLGTGVHIAPGATLCGLVEVGDYSFIGAGSVILPRITIGKKSVIGAGSVVTKNVPDNSVCWGNPATRREITT